MKIRSLIIFGSALAMALTTALSPVCLGEQKYADTEAGKHAGDEATVTGRVASVSKSGKGTVYLNFGEKFPRQTFSGVVFAKDADKVGDLAQFEGRTVALTGRIELSPDGKPQIIIRSAGQVKLADGAVSSATSAPPAPVMPVTTPAPMPAPAAPSPSRASVSPAPAIPAPKPTPPPREIE
ncbi:MAG: OB-fold nucleic acid binding domain-containing protein, partial [Chthoniobacteraceae bacterium]